jgi:hypothetical protein
VSYRANQINATSAVKLTGALVKTLDRFGLIHRDWDSSFDNKNYLYKAAVREIQEQGYEDYVSITVNGVPVPRNSSYS